MVFCGQVRNTQLSRTEVGIADSREGPQGMFVDWVGGAEPQVIAVTVVQGPTRGQQGQGALVLLQARQN